MALVKVEFEWSDEWGTCYECGRPAAYLLPGTSAVGTWGVDRLRCSVCAAMAAAEDDEQIVWLFADDNWFGRCDCGIVYETADRMEHCPEDGTCWKHCEDQAAHREAVLA